MFMFIHACMSLLLVLPPTMVGQRGLIEQALDEPARITLENVKLGEAFKIVTEQTGVRVVMDPLVMHLIPYGEETVVNATIANKPLREGLADLVSPLGMTFIVFDDAVQIIPKEALLCLGRPATWAELDTLAELSSLQPGIDDDALETLRQKVQLQVRVADAWTVLAAAIRNVAAGSGDEVLTVACGNLGWTWCLADTRIVILSIEQQIRRQLRRPIILRMNNRPVFDVMRRIGREVGVAVRVEPGALEHLPDTVRRNFALNVNQQTAEEAFDTIAAYTGLGYVIDREGVLFYRVDSVAAPPPADPGPVGPRPSSASAADPYVAKITVQLADGKTIEWLIRASELPPDLQERRQRDLTAWFDALRQTDDASGQ